MLSTGCSLRAPSAPGRSRFHLGATLRLSDVLRLPTFAAIATGLAVAGHVLAHGCSPSLGSVAVLAGGATLGRMALGRRTARLAPLVLLTLASQLVGHLVLAAAGDAGLSTGHQHAGTLPAVTGDADPSVGMVVAHTLAALICAWWLHLGEARAAALAHRLAHSLPLRLPTVKLAHRAGPAEHAPRVLASRFVRAPCLGRAPPAVA